MKNGYASACTPPLGSSRAAYKHRDNRGSQPNRPPLDDLGSLLQLRDALAEPLLVAECHVYLLSVLTGKADGATVGD